MGAEKFVPPNWAQGVIAREVGISPHESYVVQMEDETRIVFFIHKTQEIICVSKASGKVIYA